MHTSATYKGPNPLQQNAYGQHLACLIIRINKNSRSLHIYMKQHYIMESKQLLHILRRNWIYIYHVMTYFAARWHNNSTILLNYTYISHNFIITSYISFRLLLQNLNYQKLRYLDHHT